MCWTIRCALPLARRVASPALPSSSGETMGAPAGMRRVPCAVTPAAPSGCPFAGPRGPAGAGVPDPSGRARPTPTRNEGDRSGTGGRWGGHRPLPVTSCRCDACVARISPVGARRAAPVRVARRGKTPIDDRRIGLNTPPPRCSRGAPTRSPCRGDACVAHPRREARQSAVQIFARGRTPLTPASLRSPLPLPHGAGEGARGLDGLRRSSTQGCAGTWPSFPDLTPRLGRARLTPTGTMVVDRVPVGDEADQRRQPTAPA